MDDIKNHIEQARSIVVIQADNPDGDSLASSLALEHIFGDLGKTVTLYCGVEIPTYLRYMEGWDRIVHELPQQFDLSIIVDTTAVSLLENLQTTGQISWLRTKPCIVIDHHATESTIDFATALLRTDAVSTGELIFNLAITNGWTINPEAAGFLASSILSDSLGLTSEAVTTKTITTLAALVEHGANLAALDDLRRSTQKKSAEILSYKGALLQRVEYAADQRIALIHIPWPEIEKYSHAYNPSMLALDEMRMVEKVQLAIAFKTYPDGRVTAKIRANYGTRVAGKLAEHFGGGGHPYAAGFKIVNGKPFNEIKSECIEEATKLLNIAE
jgi:bifunctional oligoribonuclease and PAP phosphatase NrnA